MSSGVEHFDKRAYYDEIASDYAAHVVSPYELGVEMPLQEDLERWISDAPHDALAVDFGCGTGQSLAMYAGRVRMSLGLDYSSGMLCAAADRLADAGIVLSEAVPLAVADARELVQCAGATGAYLVRGDLHQLDWLRGRVDMAVASNSITDDSAQASADMFANVARSLKRGGELLAIVPSLDATEYVMDLHRERYGRVDASLGRLDEGGVYVCEGLRQKFWAPQELREQCERYELEVQALTKISFTWSAMAEAGWGDFEGAAPMWDWYLRARRR